MYYTKNKPLRIAYNGIVRQDGKSGNVAQFLILKELLDRGFNVDFYAGGNCNLRQLRKYSNFRIIKLELPTIKLFLRKYIFRFFPKKVKYVTERIINITLIRDARINILKQAILARHQKEKYDLIFTVEKYASFRIEGIPNISWVQGPPKRQWYMIHKLRDKVISLCGYGLYLRLKFYYIIKETIAKSDVFLSDFIICSSLGTKDWITSFGFEPQSIGVVPYPVDLNVFKPQKDLSATHQNKDIVFLWLGRSEPRKRLDLLLQAYALILEERKDIKLKIFGEFSWAIGYKQLIDNFPYPENLEYHEYIERDKVPNLMAECDFLIQPSEWENFGTAVAEAQCCGLPVIVGSTNGTKDYISSSSIIFEEYSVEALKNAMSRAINALKQDRDKLFTDARKTAEQNFSVFNIVDSVESLFQKIISVAANSNQQ